MNILVTGGAGFIGSALVARLVGAGHRVTAVDDCSAGSASRVCAGAGFHRADVATSALAGAFASCAPEAVVHLAARTRVAGPPARLAQEAAANVRGTRNVLAHCAAGGVRHFVFASSGGALYGDGAPLPTPEDRPPAPVSPYGASKAAGEAWVMALGRRAGMRCTILRYANVYGPGRPGHASPDVVTAFARAMLAGARPVVYGDGRSVRDYVHVDDAVEAAVLALAAGRAGVFNIGTGTARSVAEVFEALAAAAGYEGEPVHAPARPGELARSCLDARLAARALGWRPRVAFAEGVEGTVRALRPPARRPGRGSGPPVGTAPGAHTAPRGAHGAPRGAAPAAR